MSVCCECCVLSGRNVSSTSWSLVQRSPNECGVSVCDLETSWMRSLWPYGGLLCQKKERKRYFGGGPSKAGLPDSENGGTTVLLHVLMIYQTTRCNSQEHFDLRYWSYEYSGSQTLLAKRKKKLLGTAAQSRPLLRTLSVRTTLLPTNPTFLLHMNTFYVSESTYEHM